MGTKYQLQETLRRALIEQRLSPLATGLSRQLDRDVVTLRRIEATASYPGLQIVLGAGLYAEPELNKDEN